MSSYFYNSKPLLSLFFGGIIIFSSCKKDVPPIFKHGGSENAHIYVAGKELNGTDYVAKYWIDGQEIKLSDGTSSAGTTSIFVSGNDVYIAGWEIGPFYDTAVYWKNNKEIRLSGTYASSIFVTDNDVYVAGSDSSARAVYWKNGSKVLLDMDNVYGTLGGSIANSIFVSGNDVYAAGNDGPNAVYWKNGAETYLSGRTSDVGGA